MNLKFKLILLFGWIWSPCSYSQSLYFHPYITVVPEQDNYFYQTVGVFKGKNLDYQDSSITILERIMYGNKILQLSFSPKKKPNEREDFYRVDERKYAYSKHRDKKLIEKGILKLSADTLSIDTVITFDPETFNETYTINYNCQLIKDEHWIETLKDGTQIMGYYYNEKKEGQWHSMDFKYWRVYRDGEVTEINNLTYNELYQFQELLVNKRWQLYENEHFHWEFYLKNPNHIFTPLIGFLMLNKDQTFEFHPKKVYSKNSKKFILEGKGRWEVVPQKEDKNGAYILFQFEGGRKLIYKIKFLRSHSFFINVTE